MRYVLPALLFLLSLTSVCLAQPDAARSAEKLFANRVQPLLIQKCGGCHGDAAEALKGDFDIRTREGLLRGGESGEPALVPGDPDGSPLYVSVTWKDAGLEMPPKENDRLSPQEVADLRNWIEAGAPWSPNSRSPNSRSPNSRSPNSGWKNSGAPMTALAPPPDGTVRIETSGGQKESWTTRTYELEKTWAFHPPRKVKLPAGGHPVDAFIDATLALQNLSAAPRAERKTLNRRLTYVLTGLPPTTDQLASEFDALLEKLLASPHYGERMAQHWLDVTRYADSNGYARDEERPDAHKYRTYVIESFNTDKPFDQFAREQIAGDELGIAGQEALAFLWMGPWEITSMTSAAVARQMWLDDVVNSIGVTFLGQELRCAKCHDHKFDPIPTRDYYSMQAIFGATDHHIKAGTYKIQPREPQGISILKGGSLESPGDTVEPALLSAIAFTNEVQVPTEAEGRRAALADWIADRRNPLTARVIVNRVWAWQFGRGIVATPNGFGAMGAKPSHPELLDWLATWFMDNGWSIKKLNRLILTSAAWQRSGSHPRMQQIRKVDPDGKLLATFRPRRLSAEEIRDSMLAASGELVSRVGGPSFRAEMNWEHAFLPRRAMGKLQVLPPWQPDAKRTDRNRRSIYAMRSRNIGHPLMEILNRPLSEFSCQRRDQTTVVTQAFSLFHSEFSNARALAVAARAAQENPNDLRAQVASVFDYIYARRPTATEVTRALEHVRVMTAHHEAHPPKPQPLPTEVTLSRVDAKTGETETFPFPLEGLKDYQRDLQPWEVDARSRALAELSLVLLNSSEFLHVY